MKKFTILIMLVHFSCTSMCQWVEIHEDSTLLEVADLHFFNKDTGVVCGQVYHGVGFVLRTVDGGVTWNNTISQLSICTYLFFINDSIGYTGGQDGEIYKTEDGGITWNYCCNSGVPLDVDGFICLNDSVWLTNRYGGRVLKSTDYGLSWQQVVNTITSNYGIPYFYERNINPFYFFDDSTGFVVGHGVFKTTDGGDSWLRMHADTSYYLRSITMKSAFEGFAVGNDGIFLRTYDGGLNWSLDSISNQDLRDIKFINTLEGYCVGGGFGYFNDTTGIVLKTVDGGITWSSTEVSKSRLNAIQFIDSVGYSVGNYGQIYKYVIAANSPVDSTQYWPDQVVVYPNPFNNNITILLPNISTTDIVVTIYDANGKLSTKEIITPQMQTIEVNTRQLSRGIFTLRIIDEGNTLVKKLVKVQ